MRNVRPVVVRFVRSRLVESEILGLVVTQLGEMGAKPRQMDTGRILVCQTDPHSSHLLASIKGKGSPYPITERRVPELIPSGADPGSGQPACRWRESLTRQ